jgi:tRNA-dihydrouridine synthase 2
MVRASTLALRLECLRYGADLVFGEEIIDKKLMGAVRVENSAFGTVDFVSPREKVLIFATNQEERSRVFFQMGTANAALATQAAMLVSRDVRGIDVNMGCPKSFSVKGGMGAALLSTPEVASDILKGLRRNLPESCALTCKIRMLETTAKTRDFMQLCERSGAEAVTVHCRTRDERPAEPAHWDEIMRLWDAVKVPVIANGDFFTRRQIDEFWKFCHGSGTADGEAAREKAGPAGIMIARGALWNPSIFCREASEAPSYEDMVRNYVRAAVRANSTYQNCKWVLSQMLAGGIGVATPAEFVGIPTKAFNRQLSTMKSMGAICEKFGIPHDAGSFPEQAHMTTYYRGWEPPVAEAAAAGADGAPPQKRPGDRRKEEIEETDPEFGGEAGDDAARKRARTEA